MTHEDTMSTLQRSLQTAVQAADVIVGRLGEERKTNEENKALAKVRLSALSSAQADRERLYDENGKLRVQLNELSKQVFEKNNIIEAKERVIQSQERLIQSLGKEIKELHAERDSKYKRPAVVDWADTVVIQAGDPTKYQPLHVEAHALGSCLEVVTAPRFKGCNVSKEFALIADVLDYVLHPHLKSIITRDGEPLGPNFPKESPVPVDGCSLEKAATVASMEAFPFAANAAKAAMIAQLHNHLQTVIATPAADLLTTEKMPPVD